ncbi:mucosa-associated lymphoid tissue lymphoma translocation protein 1-like [Rhinatrema bivittatum]|uniref:mucosa-associated lymphoid tissue lymphoma translocation protein 1-like n=1 Tax=Rhinatrema bivittatum TaxID=194408 RepID=UPI00112981E9|nr:mucosa-associated lymphoid tissue lymphoma translocation protein 1-like [Rhinatrema bivittatum]
MANWNLPVGSLGDTSIAKLSELLDNNSSRGWRKLAEVAGMERRLKCSDDELETCALKVLEPGGSPSQHLLQLLSEKTCSLKHLLCCFDRMGHLGAVQLLSSIVQASVRIMVQPESQVAVEGKRASLICQAVGPPGLGYQWFCGRQEVHNATCPELVFKPVTQQASGWYICRIHCSTSFVFSKWAQVIVNKASSPSTVGGFCPTMDGLCILKQPQSCVLQEGDPLELACTAIGNPPPQYQWFRNGTSIQGAKYSCLKVKLATTAERGRYCCRVYNLFREVWSSEAQVEVGPQLHTIGNSWHDAGIPLEPTDPSIRLHASDKVGLLIGNMNYLHHKVLKAPMVDVHELTNLLRQLDFKVVSLLDLSKDEMQMAINEFLLLLDKGVYGLLYYAGHGYENFGNSFMVPIDAPHPYTSEHCLCVQRMLQSMQERQTGLNVFLLDMCRKRNMNDDILPQVGSLKVTANVVFGYATCADAEAYEISQGELSNGIFVSFLKKWLLQDEKVTVLLDKVAEDMGTCKITKGKQALELKSNLSERRALTDRIETLEGSEEFSIRNLQWGKAHVLPERQYIEFDCGIKVQLGFAAEFSNVLIIYTRIVDVPVGIMECEAKITDLSEDLEMDLKFTNKESPEATGSILFTARSFDVLDHCLYTRICGLQKLRRELAFTIFLQYRYREIDEYIEEHKSVNIGKPLVAKLSFQEESLSLMGVSGAQQPLASPDPCQAGVINSLQQSPSSTDTSAGLLGRDVSADSHPGSYCLSSQWEPLLAGSPEARVPEEKQSPAPAMTP